MIMKLVRQFENSFVNHLQQGCTSGVTVKWAGLNRNSIDDGTVFLYSNGDEKKLYYGLYYDIFGVEEE